MDGDEMNDGALSEQSLNTDKPKSKKAKLLKTATIGTKKVNYTLEFESEVVPALGSDAMFDAIIKAAKTCGTLTAEDEIDIEKQKKKFWGSSGRAKKQKRTKEKKITKPSCTRTQPIEEEEELLDLPENRETQKLLAEVDALLNSSRNESEDIIEIEAVPTATTSSNISQRSHSPRKSRKRKEKLKPSNQKNAKQIICYDIASSSEEEIVEQVEENSFGKLIFFQVTLKGTNFPIRIHEKKTIKEVRQMLGQKSGCIPECLTMFLGDDVQLEDDKTVEETGLSDLCNVDAYYAELSPEKLYLAGHEGILRLKLQTSDRRGRQTEFIYAQKSAPMRNVRDDYAKLMNLDPSQLKLMFDGEVMDLNLFPDDCDLEDEECIDVIIPTAS